MGNFKAYEINRGGVRDLAAGHSRDSGLAETAATANRVRGLGRADTAQNNHPTIERMPFDEYNTRSVEINRGPNSLLFGLGSPAGIVNQSTANAMLNVRNTQVLARYGSWGSKRFSFNHNEPIIDDMLSIYVAAVDDHRGFRRKPSYDDTQRQYGALTFQPFEGTTIRGSIERYQNQNRRPNYGTPRERLTLWLEDGRPSYNPVTRMVTYDNGSQVGPFTRSVYSPGSVMALGDPHVDGAGNLRQDRAIDDRNTPLFVDSLRFGRTVPWLRVGLDGDTNYVVTETWAPGGVVPAGIDRTDEQHLIYDRQMMETRWRDAPRDENGVLLMQPWFEPALTDKSLYDYERVNVVAPNFGHLWGKTYSLDLEQRITKDLYFGLFKRICGLT